MWPDVDKSKRKISWGGFEVEYFNQEDIKNPQICIKEIVMIYASHDKVSYDKSEVSLAVSYGTDFGPHVILFSKVSRLKYENRGIKWTATFSSDESLYTQEYDDGEYIEEEVLTEMFKNMLVSSQLYWESPTISLPHLEVP